MPIYDNNGTTSYEIGKVYDYDGTTSHQIGKVYDYNGTASGLIYTAETQYYPGGAVTCLLSDGATCRDSGSDILAQTPNTSGCTAVAYVAVDLTDVTTLTITGFLKKSAYQYAQISLRSTPIAWAGGTADPAPAVLAITNADGLNIQHQEATTETPVSVTLDWDVSALSGVHYVSAAAYSGSDAGADSYAQITSIKGE